VGKSNSETPLISNDLNLQDKWCREEHDAKILQFISFGKDENTSHSKINF
jgi:hypothetical protein